MNFKNKKELTTEELTKDLAYDPKNFTLVNMEHMYADEVIMNGIIFKRAKNSHKMKKKIKTSKK